MKTKTTTKSKMRNTKGIVEEYQMNSFIEGADSEDHYHLEGDLAIAGIV